MAMVEDQTVFLSVGSREGKPCPMTRERGVRSNAMVVFMQAAITSGIGRNVNIMHDGAPLRFRWLRLEKRLLFLSPTPNLKSDLVRTSDLCERVGTGISFRPLKAASAILSLARPSISLEGC